ncbi:hypothetical protein E4U09_003178 [Claviceps aff. purpurea]|uniref:Sm domain-containing protein n=1 Tax=Claviceps aff. purpurea TaxID=1967640 RepID=A0A9P7QGP1_9HYPO|nr:hypothetical protein E4U09_003178 [Claviceps aff. purpurea]
MEDSTDKKQSKAHAKAYLSSLLDKNLRISTTDGRLFRGCFKCTDHDQNIVLSDTFEYRRRSSAPSDVALSAEAQSASAADDDSGSMSSRYLGMVVVPGQHVVKMEVEEFASQRATRKLAV